jgi:hypothetical protein
MWSGHGLSLLYVEGNKHPVSHISVLYVIMFSYLTLFLQLGLSALCSLPHLMHIICLDWQSSMRCHCPQQRRFVSICSIWLGVPIYYSYCSLLCMVCSVFTITLISVGCIALWRWLIWFLMVYIESALLWSIVFHLVCRWFVHRLQIEGLFVCCLRCIPGQCYVIHPIRKSVMWNEGLQFLLL